MVLYLDMDVPLQGNVLVLIFEGTVCVVSMEEMLGLFYLISQLLSGYLNKAFKCRMRISVWKLGK